MGSEVFLAVGAVAMVCGAGGHWAYAQPAPAAVTTPPESAPIPPAQIPQNVKDAVTAPDCPEADKKLDAGREPEQMLAFFGIRPGMKVADLFVAGGYTTELLARAV